MNINYRICSVKPGRKKKNCCVSEPSEVNDKVKNSFNRDTKLGSPSCLKSINNNFCEINTESLIDRKRGKSKSFNTSPYGLHKIELNVKPEKINNGCCDYIEPKVRPDKFELNDSKNIKIMVNRNKEMFDKNKNYIFQRLSKKTSSLEEFQFNKLGKPKVFNTLSPKVLGIIKRVDNKLFNKEKIEAQIDNPVTLQATPKTTDRKTCHFKLEKCEKNNKIQSNQDKKNFLTLNQEKRREKKLKKKIELKNRKNCKPLKSIQRSKSLKKDRNKQLDKVIENYSKKVRFDDKSNNYHTCVLYKAENEKSYSSCLSFESSVCENWVDIMLWNQIDTCPSEFVQEFELNLLNNNNKD